MSQVFGENVQDVSLLKEEAKIRRMRDANEARRERILNPKRLIESYDQSESKNKSEILIEQKKIDSKLQSETFVKKGNKHMLLFLKFTI